MSTAPPPPTQAPRPASRAGLVIVLVVAVIVAASAVFVILKIRSLPKEAARQAQVAIQGLQRVAEAFRTGTVTTAFTSFATTVSGTRYLQVASLRENALFERRDEAALLWGTVPLPDVLVEARLGVEYTYYVDLDGPWEMTLDGSEVRVRAPRLAHNRPAPDVSTLALTVKEGSVLRDEDAVKTALMGNLTSLLEGRARTNTSLVRETARSATAVFVERWLVERFSDGRAHVVRVTFQDEPAPPPRSTSAPAIEGARIGPAPGDQQK